MTTIQPAAIETSVYRYFDERGILLYVGITSRGMSRNREHNISKEWWSYVGSQDVEHFPTREAAHAREVELIEQYRPPFNKQHNPSYGTFREQYMKMRSMPLDFQDAIELYSALKRRLPLDVLRYENGVYVLTTRIEHAAIACRLEAAPKVNVVNGRQRGQVRQMKALGPICLVYLHKGFVPDLEAVYALVRAVPEKRPSFKMTGIELFEAA